jgi:hypothetical protein
MGPLSDTSDRPAPGPFTLAIRAAFVPDGEQSPPEFSGDMYPLRFPATLDPTTGEITLANAGINPGGDLVAQFVPDEEQGSETSGAADGRDDGTSTNRAGAGGAKRADQDDDDPPWQPARDAPATPRAGPQNTSPPGPARRNEPGSWPGYGRAGAKTAAPFNGSASAADQTASDAGVAGGAGSTSFDPTGLEGRPPKQRA